MSIWEWPREHRGAIESQFYLQAGNISSVSPYTGQQTAYGPNFQRFVCKINFPQKRGPDWRGLSGFVTRLRGQNESVRMLDYFRMRCGYDIAVDPSVANWSDGSTFDDDTGWANGFLPPFVMVDESARRDDRSLVLRGFPNSIDGVMRMGDLFEARPNGNKADHGHMYEITREARSNPSGKTRITFEPGLRAGLVPGDMIVIRDPTSVFTLASDSDGIIQRSIGNLGALGLSLVEKLP